MSARTITKLIKLGYLDRKEDEADSRAYKLYLTEKAKVIIPKILEEIHKLVHLITIDLNEEEKVITIDSLNKVLNNIKKLNYKDKRRIKWIQKIIVSNKNRWVILFIVVMVTFMATLDSSIVNVALPVMAKSLNVTSAGIQLVVTSYLIIISATILVFGRLGDILGKTKVFKFGIALFTIGSLFCGITSSFQF